MASCRRIWSRTICDLTTPPRVILESSIGIVPADGETTGRRIRINRPDDENARCKVSRAWDPRKDFSQCMQQPTTPSTSSAILPQQKRTEPSWHRPCRRGVKSSLRREPDVPGDLLRALFGNVTEPSERLRCNSCNLDCSRDICPPCQ